MPKLTKWLWCYNTTTHLRCFVTSDVKTPGEVLRTASVIRTTNLGQGGESCCSDNNYFQTSLSTWQNTLKKHAVVLVSTTDSQSRDFTSRRRRSRSESDASSADLKITVCLCCWTMDLNVPTHDIKIQICVTELLSVCFWIRSVSVGRKIVAGSIPVIDRLDCVLTRFCCHVLIVSSVVCYSR